MARLRETTTRAASASSNTSYDQRFETATQRAMENVERLRARQVASRVAEENDDFLNPAAENTNKLYEPKQQEFIKWSMDNHISENATVNEDTLYLFLQHKKDTGKVKKTNRSIGYKTLEAYKSAIVKLYRRQRRTQNNQHDHPAPPHGEAMQLLKAVQKMGAERDKVQKKDRTANTAYEHYDEEGFKALCKSTLQEDGSLNQFARNMVSRTLTLLGHYTLLRGSNIRGIDLADMQYVEYCKQRNYTTPLNVLSIITSHGKTNQLNRKDITGCARHINVVVCPIAAVGMLLFTRYHLLQEPFPQFYNNHDWYDIKLLTAGAEDNTIERTYHQHYYSTKKAMKSSKIKTRKVTHNRASGAVFATRLGVSRNEVKHHGAWNRGAYEYCYSEPISIDFVLALSGHDHKMHNYYIARDINPPNELVRQVFPEAEEWLEYIKEKNAREREIDEEGDSSNRSAELFLKLLLNIRKTLLQDMAVLYHQMPNLRIFEHPIFNCKTFKDWSNLVYEKHSDQDDLFNVDEGQKFKQHLPAVYTHLSNHTKAINQLNLTMKENTNQILSQLGAQNTAVLNQLAVINSNFQKDLRMSRDSINERYLASFSNSAATTTCASNYSGNDQNTTNGTTSSNTNRSHHGLENVFIMNKGLKSVTEAYNEWQYGIDDKPPVVVMNEIFGTSWRNKTPGNKQHYNRRNKLIQEIQWTLKQGVPLNIVLKAADDLLSNGRTLYNLQSDIQNKLKNQQHLFQSIVDNFRRNV